MLYLHKHTCTLTHAAQWVIKKAIKVPSSCPICSQYATTVMVWIQLLEMCNGTSHFFPCVMAHKKLSEPWWPSATQIDLMRTAEIQTISPITSVLLLPSCWTFYLWIELWLSLSVFILELFLWLILTDSSCRFWEVVSLSKRGRNIKGKAS